MAHLNFSENKYRVLHQNGMGLHAERNGEPWRDLVGDGLVLAMFQDFEAAIECLEEIVNETAHGFGSGWDDTEMAKTARAIINAARGR